MTVQPITHGTAYEGGFFGGIVNINGVPHAIAWAPKAEGETQGIWHADEPGLIAPSCNDSVANTQAMAKVGSAIAQWALGLCINGHTDWCIPARDVLEQAYRYLKPTTEASNGWMRCGDNPSSVPVGYPYRTQAAPIQTTFEAFQEGGAEAFEDTWYWGSTQASASSAWFQNFYYGRQGNSYLYVEMRVRAVRLIQL